MRRRILQFIPSFQVGGSERHSVALTNQLATRDDLDVFVATLNNNGPLIPELRSSQPVREFRLTSFYDLNFVRQVHSCAEYLKEQEIEVVHTHDFYTNIFGTAAAAYAGVKCRITSKRETTAVRSKSQQVIEKFAFGLSKAIQANSKVVRDHLITIGIDPEKIDVIYNGVDTELFSKANGNQRDVLRSLNVPENFLLITLVANLRHPVKNVPMLLRAATRLSKDFTNVYFIIAGEGDLATGMREMADSLGLGERVKFLGSYTDIPALLSASYACVLTSKAEGFSNAILEYMAAAKPVVATNVGGAAEAITDGMNGFLVPSDDDEALADRISILLRDQELSRSMGSAGRQIVEDRFSLLARIEETVEMYHKLLCK